jgi:hypothetical protein
MVHILSTLKRLARLPDFIVDAKLEIAHQTKLFNERFLELRQAIDGAAQREDSRMPARGPALDFPVELPHPELLASDTEL